MSSETVLQFTDVSKTYPPQRTPLIQLWNQLRGHQSTVQGSFHALKSLSLQVNRGQSLGIVGLNGAGKSTLLQLAAGTLTPSTGQVISRGRVAALLELGSGLNPEATGRENIYLYAATMGMGRAQVEDRIDSIIEFSGLSGALDMPVKTYSSGMQVRLAFSVATSVDPDVLIVDEALSVGDGVFAKRSFDRVMELREKGAAILLCSHALFHVDLFCERTLWLHQGEVRTFGPTSDVVPRYKEFLDELNSQPATSLPAGAALGDAEGAVHGTAPKNLQPAPRPELVRLVKAQVSLDGTVGQDLHGWAYDSELIVDIDLQVSVEEPEPLAAVVISSDSGKIIGSTFSPAGAIQAANAEGHASIQFTLPQIPLNRGRYRIGVYLLCARGQYVYEWVDPFAHINLEFEGPHQGPWLMPGRWADHHLP